MNFQLLVASCSHCITLMSNDAYICLSTYGRQFFLPPTTKFQEKQFVACYQVRYEEIMSEPSYLDGVLADGAGKATKIADATLNNVYQAMGFLRRST